MVSKGAISRREENMFDLVSKLASGTAQMGHTEVSGFNHKMPYARFDYLIDDKPFKSLALLIPVHVPRQELMLDQLVKKAVHTGYGQPAIIFYKDGESFFRNLPKEDFGRQSLKQYSKEEKERMVEMSKEELFVISQRRAYLQYFNPESANLDGMMTSMQFSKVRYVYDHIGPERFRPEDADSKRLYSWEKSRRTDSLGPFYFSNGHIRAIKAPSSKVLNATAQSA